MKPSLLKGEAAVTGPPLDRVRWLRQELEAWVRDGTISAEQAAGILARYPLEPLAVRTQTQKRIAAAFAVLGAVLVGLGIVLFFASNWAVMPRWTKFGLVLATTVGAYALGYWLRFVKQYPGVGSALLLLGALLYGAGIFLVGQMFHVQAEPHYGLLLWAAGILPVGYALPHGGILTVASVLIAYWVAVVGVLGLAQYGVDDPVYPIRNLVAAGIILYAVGRIHATIRGGSRLGRPYLVTGALVVLLTYFVFTEFLWWDSGGGATGPALPAPFRTLRAGLLIASVATVAGHVWLSQNRPLAALESAGLIVLLLSTWLAPAPAGAWPVSVLVSALFFASCLGLVSLGVRRSDRQLVNLGLVFFSLGVAARYVDISGSLLNTSLAFIGGGVLLLGGGWLIERTRRRLLRRIGAALDEP